MKLNLPISPRNARIVLMMRDSIPWRCILEPEQKLCVQIADRLRAYTLDGKLKGVWSHIANEGKRHVFVGIILRAMGLIKVTPDYFFIWEGGGGLIEIKAGKGVLSENQKHHIVWCADEKVNHAICRSVDEVLQTLVAWGALTL
jgi:hypothetical protein